MQGQFWKIFCGAVAGTRAGGPRRPVSRPLGAWTWARARGARYRSCGAAPGRSDEGALRAFPGSARPPPGAARHETGPYTTFGRHRSNAPEIAKLKPQVDGLRFFRNEGYDRGVWVKSSRYPGFVMAVFRGAYPRCSGPCLTPIQEDDS